MINDRLYVDDIELVANLNIPWDKLKSKTIVVSGAGGLIGSFLIDVLMYKNLNNCLGCHIVALGRNSEKAKKKFAEYWDLEQFRFVSHDINKPLDELVIQKADYVLHLASNTHPLAYSTEPIETITTNVIGTYNMLEFSVKYGCERFLLASSNEVYGENRGDVDLFDENYCGYINCNTLRAGYPESKRCSEALCQAYKSQKNQDFVIARLTRSYGPTMLESDTKAISQFIKKGISGEDIVLKSEGNQFYSYIYVADAVYGLLTILLCGESGEAYNIADSKSDIKLRNLAELTASYTGRKVVFQIPDDIEKAGYSVVIKARLNGDKLKKIGWKPMYTIETGLKKTIKILQTSNRIHE